MFTTDPIYLGIDCGATTSKTGAIDVDGRCVSKLLRQSPTNGSLGEAAILDGWIAGAESFLQAENLSWDQVSGVGLAVPGPYQSYGVLGKLANLPDALEGWHYLDAFRSRVAKAAGRAVRVETGNDGHLAGLAEAHVLQAHQPGAVLMLSPGSGLGCSFVDADGALLQGDHLAGAHLCHMPAPFHLLELPRFRCGCGRHWGCFESYTSISGLVQMLEHYLPQFPQHELAGNAQPRREQALSLRSRAQEGDPLALKIFEVQAAAMGLAIVTACMAYDPTHIVIGGGLMDPEATTEEFRRRYLDRIRETVARYWPEPGALNYSEASMGELSQAIGAALMIRRILQSEANL